MIEWNWQTREEWAKRVRSGCYEEIPATPTELADYASEDEAARAVGELKQLWRQRGRAMQELKAKHPLAFMRSGETGKSWKGRYAALSEDDRRIAEEIFRLQDCRQRINRSIADIQQGTVPWRKSPVFRSAGDLVRTANLIVQRYVDARQRTFDAYREEAAKRPIDDAAWEEELRRRRMMETRGLFTVNVR
jgi:hypothetical protein